MAGRGKKLIKNTAIVSLGAACTKGIMVIMTPLIIRWMSQGDYGTFDLITTYISLAVPIVTMSIGDSVFRFMIGAGEESDRREIVKCGTVVVFIGLIAGALITLAGAIIFPSFRAIAPYALIYLIAQTGNTFLTMASRGDKNIVLYTEGNIIFILIMAPATWILVGVLGLGLKGIMISYSLGYFAGTILMAFKFTYLRRLKGGKPNRELLSKMLKYSIPLVPTAVSWWIINVSDRTVIGIFLGAAANGIYAAACKIPNLCQTIYSIFHVSWQESASETVSDKDSSKYYGIVMNEMFTVMASIGIGVMCVNFLIFQIVFTEEYYIGYYLVPILILSVVSSSLAQFLGGVYIARMQSKRNGATTVIAAIINLVIHLALIGSIGIFAAPISTFISYTLLTVMRVWDLGDIIKYTLNPRVVLCIIGLVYFATSCYLEINTLNYVNLVLGVIFVCVINGGRFLNILKQVGERIKK